MSCRSCYKDIKQQFTCRRVAWSKSARSPFDINMPATMAFRGIGCGFGAMKEWSGTMNLPNCLSQNAYINHHSKLHAASRESLNVIVAETKQTIANAYT